MQEYYFLFALALIWTIFATIQDIRKREVANWLNFSLIAFALAYRAFYATINNQPSFFYLGLTAFVLFFILAHALYYSKAFAGGDAKLLMGFSLILPYTSITSLLILSLSFFFLLFFIGAIYSIIYSFFIASKHKHKFKKEFLHNLQKYKTIMVLTIILFFIATILGTFNNLFFILAFLLLLPLIFVYTKALDKCMVSLLPPSKLTEGDWILKDMKIGNKTIKKTIHGLSLSDIALLKAPNKKIQIKQGIPFVPAFLMTLLIMVFFSSALDVFLSAFL